MGATKTEPTWLSSDRGPFAPPTGGTVVVIPWAFFDVAGRCSLPVVLFSTRPGGVPFLSFFCGLFLTRQPPCHVFMGYFQRDRKVSLLCRVFVFSTRQEGVPLCFSGIWVISGRCSLCHVSWCSPCRVSCALFLLDDFWLASCLRLLQYLKLLFYGFLIYLLTTSCPWISLDSLWFAGK